jgi:hypothetical protein
MSRVFISYGGPDRVIVDEADRRWNFEMHPYCGPIATNKSGDPAKNQPAERSSFWRVTSWWAQQGQKIGADGLCVWTKPPEPKLVHLGGRHYKIVPESVSGPSDEQGEKG